MEQTKIYKHRKYIELDICNHCFLLHIYKNTAYNQSVVVQQGCDLFLDSLCTWRCGTLNTGEHGELFQESCLYGRLGQRDDSSSYGKRKF